MKRLAAILRCLAVVVLLSVGQQALAQPSMLISSTVEQRGDPATVTAFYVSDGTAIVADVVIGFDPSVLLPSSQQPCSGSVDFSCQVTAPDRIRVSAVSLSAPVSSQAVSIGFQVLSIAAGGISPVTIISEDYSNSMGMPVPADGSADGHVNIQIQPGFIVGRVGGDGNSMISVPIRLDTGTGSVASGVFEFSFDQSALIATDSCFASLGTVFVTHDIDCTVNNSTGRVTVSFESAAPPVEQSISGNRNLGDIDFQVISPPVDGAAAEGYPLSMLSETLRDLDRNPIPTRMDGDGELRVVPSWPVDEYEYDNAPLDGTALSSTGALDSFITQVRSFHVDGDEEWLILERPVDLCPRGFSVIELSSPFGSRAPDTLVPRIELYGFSRLEVLVPPFATFGDCGITQGPLRVVVPPDGLFDNTLVRIRNCGAVPAGGITYNLRVRLPFSCPTQDIAQIKGTVTEAGSGAPVSVFLVTDNNQVTVSSPTTGIYQLAEVPDEDITIQVSSNLYSAAPVFVPKVAAGSIRNDVDFIVTRGNQIFSDGFE